jgi:hypothetical protein
MAELAPTDYAFLIILKAEGRELSNTEMDRLYRVRLKGEEYAKLNAAGYVSSDTTHRPYRHSITRAGLKILAGRLTVDEGQRRAPRELPLWAALVAQQNEIVRLQAGASTVAEKPVADLDDRIRTVYAELAGVPGAWVDLTALRPLLADVPKADLDRAFVRMLDAPDVRLEPEPFGHRVGAAERRAAVHVGGEDRHKLAIGLR